VARGQIAGFRFSSIGVEILFVCLTLVLIEHLIRGVEMMAKETKKRERIRDGKKEGKER
jgi:hypothetical protein